MKKVLVSLFVICLLAGCTSEKSDEALFDIPPLYASFEVDEQFFTLANGSYSWTMKEWLTAQTVQTDYAAPFTHADALESYVFPLGTKVNILVDGNPKITVRKWLDETISEDIPIRKKQLTLPNDPGEYIYEVFAEWKQGYRSYVVKVEMK